MELGGGLQAAAILAGVPLCRALEWLEHGERFPSGLHSAFAREVKAIEAARARQFRSTNLETPYTRRAGLSANGNGNGSNGSHELLRIEDL